MRWDKLRRDIILSSPWTPSCISYMYEHIIKWKMEISSSQSTDTKLPNPCWIFRPPRWSQSKFKMKWLYIPRYKHVHTHVHAYVDTYISAFKVENTPFNFTSSIKSRIKLWELEHPLILLSLLSFPFTSWERQTSSGCSTSTTQSYVHIFTTNAISWIEKRRKLETGVVEFRNKLHRVHQNWYCLKVPHSAQSPSQRTNGSVFGFIPNLDRFQL